MSHKINGIIYKLPNSIYFMVGQLGCLSNSLKHINDPFLPFIFFRYVIKQSIIFFFMTNNVMTKIQNRQGKQLFLYQKKNVDDTTSSTITVQEWMNGFKLIMRDSHTN